MGKIMNIDDFNTTFAEFVMKNINLPPTEKEIMYLQYGYGYFLYSEGNNGKTRKIIWLTLEEAEEYQFEFGDPYEYQDIFGRYHKAQ